MPVDATLCIHILAELRDLQGGSLPVDALLVAVECRAGRPLTTQAASAALAYCQDKGWIGLRKDGFDRDVYWLKDSGENRLKGGAA